ncbi:DNA methyltransferase [Arthrobacter oryzae]|uniref:DNA methyltransferase n=1 Tax=Arthrobacter oryzae TaxID=409290 RepID=UPI0028649B14|nr:DNA methyltransferase [Arthrobacter oryzae]MDR6506473.1 DNA modification methylase [Arthrobacter oryzae]
MDKNQLYYGDNLDVLRQYVRDESVDLVYLDPPFNSNRNYSVIFSRNGKTDGDNAAQIEAFEDTWTWTHQTEVQYNKFVSTGPGKVVDALSAFRTLLGENDALAYLVNMAPRLVELHRVLRSTGSLYLHCDPTMSHYLKILLDSIFGPARFKNEIIWKRTGAHNDTKQGRTALGAVHDVILFYTKDKLATWNPFFTPYDDEYLESEYRHIADDGRLYKEGDLSAAKPGGDVSFDWPVKRFGNDPWQADLDDEYLTPLEGWSYKMVRPYNNRFWAYSKANLIEFARNGKLAHRSTGQPRLMLFAEDMPGIGPQDVWTDIKPIGAGAAEKLGYPTQKPVSLLERIVALSSNPGDVVLDPFCGCGTTVDAAQRLGRHWIGIDVTYIAIDLIVKRLQHTHGTTIQETFAVNGIPRDLFSAQALFDRSPFDFERWAVSMINAEPNQKQVGDKGIDGVARFPIDGSGKIGKVLVSVKGGKNLNPGMVRDLKGTVETQKAQMGVLITFGEATRGVKDAIDHGGLYVHPANSQQFPLLQHITIAELLAGKRPELPPTILPYIEAKKQSLPKLSPTLF